jgi:hypothetical protein
VLGAPRRCGSTNGGQWRQARGKAGNAVEVAGEHDSVTAELGDEKAQWTTDGRGCPCGGAFHGNLKKGATARARRKGSRHPSAWSE